MIYYLLTIIFLTSMNFDLFFSLIIVISIVQHLIYTNYINKVNFNMEQETTGVDRKAEYIKNLFKNETYIRESKTLQYAEYFIHWNNHVMDESRRIMKKYYQKSVAKSILTTFIGVACSIAAILYLCVNMIQKVYSPGDFVYLIGVFEVCLELVTKLFQVIPDIRLQSLYIDNMRRVLDYTSIIEKDKNSISAGLTSYERGTIELKNISFSYPAYKNFLLKDINLKCKAGEKIAIVGENGCGKSTLIKLLIYFYIPDYGEVKYEGTPYVLYNAVKLRDNFGVVF